jgi:hypothetical protein
VLVIVLCYIGAVVTVVWRPAARPLENVVALLNHLLTGTLALLAMFPTAGPIRAKGGLTIAATVVSVVNTVTCIIFARLEDKWTDAALEAAATALHQQHYTEAVTVEVASAQDAGEMPHAATTTNSAIPEAARSVEISSVRDTIDATGEPREAITTQSLSCPAADDAVEMATM